MSGGVRGWWAATDECMNEIPGEGGPEGETAGEGGGGRGNDSRGVLCSARTSGRGIGLTCCPSSEPSSSRLRRMSPTETWTTPNFSTMALLREPFPQPGPPAMMSLSGGLESSRTSEFFPPASGRESIMAAGSAPHCLLTDEVAPLAHPTWDLLQDRLLSSPPLLPPRRTAKRSSRQPGFDKFSPLNLLSSAPLLHRTPPAPSTAVDDDDR